MPIKMPNYLAASKTTQRSPLQVLREAANDLAAQTQGLVEGSVFTLNAGGSSLFRYTFYLLVPSLNDYTDPLFYAWHGIDLYPVNVMRAGGKQGQDEVKCQTASDFQAGLEHIFDSMETRERIQTMIELARK